MAVKILPKITLFAPKLPPPQKPQELVWRTTSHQPKKVTGKWP
jgi:hypothetical protein